MTTDTTRRSIPARARAGWLERLTAGGSWTVFALLVLVFVAILVMNPSFGSRCRSWPSSRRPRR